MSRLSVRLSVAESGLRVQPADFKVRISSLIDETVESLESIWKEAGYEENECQGLLGDILTKLKTLCSAELCAEQQILEHAKNQVLTKFHEYQNLCNKLGRTGPQNVNQLGDNYADRLSQLEKLISDIEIEISQRQEILTEKREEVEKLANKLGEDIKQGYDGGNQYCELDDIRIELISEYKKNLDEIKLNRISEIKVLAADILKYLNDLAVTKEGPQNLPDSKEFSDIDNSLLKSSELDENFGFHRRDIERLTLRLKNLQKEKEKRKEELSRNGAEIARMWTLLRIPTTERTSFQNSFEMNLSIATLTRGREELARLKRIRMESIETVVTSLREEIYGYWQELGIQSEELMEKEFPSYFCPIKDLDDLGVEKHEEYCSTIKLKVEQLRPLLLKIAKREAVVEERVELEYLMMNPERLTARGPKAREDRKREEEMQRRVKNLDKLTKEVLGYITTWEETNGTTFLYAGERYTDRIEAQEEHYIESRNSLRNQRKKKDGKELSGSGTLSTTPNTRIIKKANATAPVTSNQMGQTSTKLFKEKPGVLTLSTTTAGIIPSHSNIPNNYMNKTKGKVATSGLNDSNCNNNPNNIKLNNEQLDTSISLTQEEFNSLEQQENQNNYDDVDDHNSERHSLSSNYSDETEYTSMTEIKERASTATIVRMASNNLER